MACDIFANAWDAWTSATVASVERHGLCNGERCPCRLASPVEVLVPHRASVSVLTQSDPAAALAQATADRIICALRSDVTAVAKSPERTERWPRSIMRSTRDCRQSD